MKKVFLVDDEKAVLNWLQEAINWEEFGCQVAGYDDRSLVALEKMKHEKFDILITDISMPEVNGLELIKKVKAFQPSIRIIIISAYSDFSYTKEAILLGAEDYILKPLNKLEIEEALNRIIFSMSYLAPSFATADASDFKIFQSNMLQRWVKGSDNMEDVNEQMSIAGIDIYQKNYSVFILHVPHLEKEKMLQVFHFCATSVPLLSGGVFFDSATDIVGVLSGTPLENKATLTQLSRHLERQFATVMYITTGENVSHFLQVKNSYESAKFFRLAGMFTQEAVFATGNHFSAQFLLRDPAFRNLQMQLEDKNINKSIESALNILTSSERKADPATLFFQRLVIALLFLKIYESIINTPKATELASMMTTFQQAEPLAWLTDYMAIFRKYHNEQMKALHPYVLRIINLVEENYQDSDLNLSTVAEKLKVTSVYLGQLFYLQTEQHFNDYLTDVRLKKVCQLLTTTPTKIGDIAKQVGFSSQSYLNRVFRKKYHLTPMEYRQLPTE